MRNFWAEYLIYDALTTTQVRLRGPGGFHLDLECDRIETVYVVIKFAEVGLKRMVSWWYIGALSARGGGCRKVFIECG